MPLTRGDNDGGRSKYGSSRVENMLGSIRIYFSFLQFCSVMGWGRFILLQYITPSFELNIVEEARRGICNEKGK